MGPFLELLHPDGDGPAARIGSGTAPPAEPHGGAPAPGLIVLAPTRAEARDPGWLERAAELCRLGGGDVVAIAGPRPRRLRAALREAGLVPAGSLVHVPDVERSRYVTSATGAALAYATRSVLPLGRAKRLAARGLALPGLGRLGPTTLIYRRPGARPLAGWVAQAGVPQPAAVVLGRSQRAGGSVIVHALDARGTPRAVVKVGAEAAREAAALHGLAPAARAAGAAVPEVLGELRAGGADALAMSPLPGAPAARRVRGSDARARDTLGDVAGWLRSWNARTATRRAFGHGDAERLLLEPARRLEPELGVRGYAERLASLCERAAGRQVPWVAAHNDLTAANLIVDDEGPLGVADWEEAEAGALPLGDLLYSAADLLAAARGYDDRPAAFAECAAGSSAYARAAREALARARGELEVDEETGELCRHASWLRHADNERARAAPDAGRPFLAIARSVARSLQPAR